MSIHKTAVVVPSIRKKCIEKFLYEWKNEFSNCVVYVIEDNSEKTFDLDSYGNVRHFAWKQIDDMLGNKHWIIPRRTDCIRSFGFYMAWKQGANCIISLDDDCYPTGDHRFVSAHVERLYKIHLDENERFSAWTSTIDGLKPRGVPFRDTYRSVNTMISHGLWNLHLDLDAITQVSLLNMSPYGQWEHIYQYIPRGNYYPMCGMNLAFRAVITPIMYFLLMGNGYPYDRFGDIWCGIFSKRILDHFREDVWSGTPVVKHCKASNPWINLDKERCVYKVNETLWNHVDMLPLTGLSHKEVYREIANHVNAFGRIYKGSYWSKLSEAMNIWVDLFEES